MFVLLYDLLPTILLTSGLMELQCDVGIKAQAEVVIEHIQRELGKKDTH